MVLTDVRNELVGREIISCSKVSYTFSLYGPIYISTTRLIYSLTFPCLVIARWSTSKANADVLKLSITG